MSSKPSRRDAYTSLKVKDDGRKNKKDKVQKNKNEEDNKLPAANDGVDEQEDSRNNKNCQTTAMG